MTRPLSRLLSRFLAPSIRSSWGGALAASVLVLAGLFGCQSDDDSLASDVAPATDRAADAGTAGLDAADALLAGDAGPDGVGVADAGPIDGVAALAAPRCGLAPYQVVPLVARDVMRTAQAGELAGVVATFKTCPGRTFPLGPDGQTQVMVTAGAETWIRFEAPGYLPWIVGEVTISNALPAGDVVASMVPLAFAAALVPGYDPTQSLVYVQVQQGRAASAEACHSPAEVALSVVGHPEATVLYRAVGSGASYGPATSTTLEGIALISGLPPTLTEIALAASKPGCVYVLAYGDANSPALLPILRTPLAPGGVTHQIFNPAR